MGFMTVVSILNDGWDTIKKHPDQFIKNIEMGMAGDDENGIRSYHSMVNEYPVDNFSNPMEVAKSFHADTPHVFFAGRNCMTMLTDYSAKDKKEIEFQLKRIKEAKSLINYQEKELKRKLEKFSLFKKGDVLKCKKDYKNWRDGHLVLLCEQGMEYTIISIVNEGSSIIIDTKEGACRINILDIEDYFSRNIEVCNDYMEKE